MKKYLLTFEDAFSGATTQKEVAADKNNLHNLQNCIKNRKIVHAELKNGIRWCWVLKRIEET